MGGWLDVEVRTPPDAPYSLRMSCLRAATRLHEPSSRGVDSVLAQQQTTTQQRDGCVWRAPPLLTSRTRGLSLRPSLSNPYSVCSPAPAALHSSCPQLTAPTEVGGSRTWRLQSTVGIDRSVCGTFLHETAHTCHPAHPLVSELLGATAEGRARALGDGVRRKTVLSMQPRSIHSRPNTLHALPLQLIAFNSTQLAPVVHRRCRGTGCTA